MKFSVVICSTGREELYGTLKSVEEQSWEDMEILVVSNRDLTVEDAFNQVKLIKTKGKNLSEQRNIGIKSSDGEIVAFIDDDAIAGKNWLKNLASHYGEEEVACVGGKIIPEFEQEPEGKIADLEKYLLYGLVGATFIEWEKPRELKSPLIWGCNISFRKEIFDQIGYFPPELGRSKGNPLGEEERYMELKVMDTGHKVVYDPKAVVSHLIDQEQLEVEHLVRKSFWQGISEVKRLSLSDNFKQFDELKREIKSVGSAVLLQKYFLLDSLNNLKDRIDCAREIGRIFALINVIGGLENE